MSDEAMKVEVRADFAQFEKALLKLQNQTDAGLNRVEKKFSKSNANLRKETSQLGSVFDGLGKSIGGAGGGLPGLGGGVGALGIAGAAAAIGVGALVASLRGLKDAAKFAADLTDSADRIGVTVEALQELRYAADETGVPLASLDSGLESLNATLGAFKTGIGAARITPVFKALGLTREDLVGVENARDLLPVLADRLGQVGDRAAQVQLAKKLGIESLLPLLRQGSDGLNRMASEGRDLGLVLSNEVVSGLDETDRALEKNQQQIDANVRSMQANLAPFFLWCSDWLAKLSRGFTDLLDRGKRIEERNDRNLASRSTQLEEPVRRAYEMSNRRGRPIMPWQQRLIDEKARVDAEIAQRARERIATSGPSAADRTREGGYDLNLPAERSSGSGGGGGARGNNDAARAAETALRRQRRLDDDLAAASTATLQAQSQLATSAEQRASIAIQLLDSERQQRQVQLDRLVTDGEITAADKARLTAAEAGLYTAREANIAAELQRSIIERQGQAESDLLGITRDMLVTRSGNAATAAERLATDKAILELHQRERRSALERALLAEGITDVERQTLQAMIAKLDELEPAETRSLEDSASRGVQTARGFVAEGQERRDLPADQSAAIGEVNRMEGAGEIDHRAAMEARAAIDEEYWNRRLTGEGSMLDSLAQLSRSGNAKLAAIGKAAALAQATISGFLAIQNAWASAIFPANLPAVAITTAATAANIAGIAGMATGGHVRGPGTGTSDSIPVMLSDGEFVVRASQTKKHKKLLEALNAGMVPGYASGGLVTAGTNEGGNGREQYLGGPVDPA